MRIRVAAAGGPRTWRVSAPADTTLGALARMVGLPAASVHDVDGVRRPIHLRLAEAGVHDGSLLAPVVAPPGDAPSDLGRSGDVAIVALEAHRDGRTTGRWALAPGRHTLGRHPSVDVLLDDPEVAGLHAELIVDHAGAVELRWREPGAPGRTIVAGDEVVAGATRLRLVVDDLSATNGSAPAARAVPATGDIVHNRPPRPANPPAPRAPRAAEAPSAPHRSASPRALVSMLVPSLAGVALAVVLRPEIVLLALLAPIGALATWAVLRVLDATAARRHRDVLVSLAADHATALDVYAAAHGAHLTCRHPSPEEVAQRIRDRHPRLWERRPIHDDFLTVAVGRGAVRPADAAAAVDAPVEISLVRPVGVVGDRATVLGLTRSLLVQLAAHHGPADLTFDAWSTDHFAWQWLRWLPHHRRADPGDPDHADHVHDPLTARASHPLADPARRCVVVDAGGLPTAWRRSWSQLVHGGTAIVVAERAELLPEQCRVVVHADAHGVRVQDHDDGSAITVHAPWSRSAACAEALAARLAPMRDADAAHRSLPQTSSLLALLAGAHAHDEPAALVAVRRRWAASRAEARCAAPIGQHADGPVELDLVRDGPHALVAGTTGSGKSELLRSLVLSFAASVDPQHLAFVLVDYKGGSAFDGLQALPHVVDVVTDLDATEAARAVRGLEAEVLRRERILRAAGAGDIAAYHGLDRCRPEPLPRLAVVVDEFATLAQELPAFVDALVDVAQRGRSLGVHLVLATQRPNGAVKDSIRTNTNLRIALRVVDAHDSRDIVGVDHAASIGRHERGRAIVRLGAGEHRMLQTAHSGQRVRPPRAAPVAAPFGMPEADDAPGAPTELDMLVAAIRSAHAEAGGPAPRRPWSEPLPSPLTLDEAHRVIAGEVAPHDGPSGWHVLLGLTDDQVAQRHGPCTWRPDDGNLLVAGAPGSGTADALASCIAGAVTGTDRGAHVYVVSAMPRAFSWCEPMAAVGAVIGIDDDERVRRLLGTLTAEVRTRRAVELSRRPAPALVVIDGVGELRSLHDTPVGLEVLEQLERLAADGPAVGIHFVFAAEHPSALGHRLDRTVAQRILLRLADRAELSAAGVRDLDPSTLPRGRGVDATRRTLVQVAHLDDGSRDALLDADRAALVRGATPAPPIGALPDHVDATQLPTPWTDERGVLHVPLGIGHHALLPVGLELRAGAHALVLGAAGTGKSPLLVRMCAALVAAGVHVVDIGTASPVGSGTTRDRTAVARVVDELLCSPQRTVVVIDDADVVDVGEPLDRLLAARPPHVHVVAAARSDRLRPLFRHWTTDLRRSGHAVLLRGDDIDAELVGVRPPRRTGPWPPGRGWLVRDGVVEQCQFATGDHDAARPA